MHLSAHGCAICYWFRACCLQSSRVSTLPVNPVTRITKVLTWLDSGHVSTKSCAKQNCYRERAHRGNRLETHFISRSCYCSLTTTTLPPKHKQTNKKLKLKKKTRKQNKQTILPKQQHTNKHTNPPQNKTTKTKQNKKQTTTTNNLQQFKQMIYLKCI